MAVALEEIAPDISQRAGSGYKAKTRRRVNWRLIALVALGLVVLAGALAYWWGQQHPATAPVATVAVSRGNVETTVLATGKIEASDLVSVGAQTSGAVKAVYFALGDRVQANDVVVEIDSLNQENSLKSANAALDNIKAQRDAQDASRTKYQNALVRAKELNAKQVLSQTDLDAAQANVDSTEATLRSLDAQIEEAKLNVTSAQLNLDRTKITAAMGGTVVAVLVDVGQTVNASQSAPTVMKIANLDTMKIKTQISEADVQKIKIGQTVTFTVLGDPSHPISAKVESIEPAPSSIATQDSASSTTTAIYYNCIFTVPNQDHVLRIDMTAKVTILLERAEAVLTLPASALGNQLADGSYRVGVVDPSTGEVTSRSITVGLNDKVTAEIRSGLEEGDKVVAKAGAGTASTGGAQTSTGSRGGGGFLGL